MRNSLKILYSFNPTKLHWNVKEFEKYCQVFEEQYYPSYLQRKTLEQQKDLVAKLTNNLDLSSPQDTTASTSNQSSNNDAQSLFEGNTSPNWQISHDYADDDDNHQVQSIVAENSSQEESKPPIPFESVPQNLFPDKTLSEENMYFQEEDFNTDLDPSFALPSSYLGEISSSSIFDSLQNQGVQAEKRNIFSSLGDSLNYPPENIPKTFKKIKPRNPNPGQKFIDQVLRIPPPEFSPKLKKLKTEVISAPTRHFPTINTVLPEHLHEILLKACSNDEDDHIVMQDTLESERPAGSRENPDLRNEIDQSRMNLIHPIDRLTLEKRLSLEDSDDELDTGSEPDSDLEPSLDQALLKKQKSALRGVYISVFSKAPLQLLQHPEFGQDFRIALGQKKWIRNGPLTLYEFIARLELLLSHGRHVDGEETHMRNFKDLYHAIGNSGFSPDDKSDKMTLKEFFKKACYSTYQLFLRTNTDYLKVWANNVYSSGYRQTNGIRQVLTEEQKRDMWIRFKGELRKKYAHPEKVAR